MTSLLLITLEGLEKLKIDVMVLIFLKDILLNELSMVCSLTLKKD